MSKPVVLGIYGAANSGKTMVITQMIRRLCDEGFRVSSIKHSSKPFDFDMKNKDTYRHTFAGAQSVLFTSPFGSILQTTEILDEQHSVDLLIRIARPDVILIEGAQDPVYPKIRIGSIKQRKNTLATFRTGDVDSIIAIINEVISNNVENK